MEVTKITIVFIAIAATVQAQDPAFDSCMRHSIATNATLKQCASRAGILANGYNETLACRDTMHRLDYLCFFDAIVKCFGGQYSKIFSLEQEYESTLKTLSFDNVFDFWCERIERNCECNSPNIDTPSRSPTEGIFPYLTRLIPLIDPFCSYLSCLDNLPQQTCQYSRVYLKKIAQIGIEHAAHGMPAQYKDEFDTMIDEICQLGLTNYQQDCAFREVKKAPFEPCAHAVASSPQSITAHPTCAGVEAIKKCLDSYIGVPCSQDTSRLMQYALHFAVPTLPFRCGTSAGTIIG